MKKKLAKPPKLEEHTDICKWEYAKFDKFEFTLIDFLNKKKMIGKPKSSHRRKRRAYKKHIKIKGLRK